MLYAIGDIHGRFDLLLKLHQKIMIHAAQFEGKHTVITLGDYVDRGPKSKEVIDFLIKKPFTGFDHVYLRGNHEDMFVKSVYGTAEEVVIHQKVEHVQTTRRIFLENGGVETLESFGIENPYMLLIDNKEISKALIPYVSFFAGLKDYHKADGYLFVHAGIMPNGQPIEEQDRNVLYWIRDKFLDSDMDFGYKVIHGHTITCTRGCGVYPEVKPNRINIDTGAYYTHVLTAVCLDEKHERRPEVLNTHPDG